MKKVIVLCLSLLGCAEDLTPAWEVIEPRPYGSRLFIEGDTEARTRPRPGESFGLVRYFVSPEEPQASYSADVVACIGAQLPGGEPACFQQLDLPTLTTDPYEQNDRLTMRGLTIPAEAAALPRDLVNRIYLFSGVCVDGRVERVPGKSLLNDSAIDLFRCTDNAKTKFKDLITTMTSVALDFDQDESVNHHPSFDCDPESGEGACTQGVSHSGENTVPGSVVLARPSGDGYQVEAWPSWDEAELGPLPWANCRDAEGLPQVRQETDEHLVRVRFDASDRETFDEIIDGPSPTPRSRREDLSVSHAITTRGGELSGQKSLLDRAVPDSDAEIELSYFPGDEDKGDRIAQTGRLVRFYFALHDFRGGYDFTTRELCLLPPR